MSTWLGSTSVQPGRRIRSRKVTATSVFWTLERNTASAIPLGLLWVPKQTPQLPYYTFPKTGALSAETRPTPPDRKQLLKNDWLLFRRFETSASGTAYL